MLNFVLNFISPMFYKILYMSIIGIFVGLFILIIRKILDKRISPKWKCFIWLLLMLSLIVPVKFDLKNNHVNTKIISISGLIEPIQSISSNSKLNKSTELEKEYEEQEKAVTEVLTESKNNETDNINLKNLILNIIIPILWVTGIALNFLLLISGNNNIKKNIKVKVFNDKILDSLIEECKNVIGVKSKVEVILQDFKQTPSIIGIFKPKILITKEFLLQDYTTKKYIIMHELSHYKRKDLIFNYILLLITIIHWFNPFVWLFFKRIRQDIELATDEMVLDKLKKDEKKEYGMTLINSLNIFQEEKYTAKLLCVTDDSKNMERRIKMVKLSEKFKNNKLLIAIISIIIIIVGILLFFTQNTNSKIIAEEQNSTQNIKETSKKYEYKAFKPSFKKTSESTYDDYDFTQDMIYKDNIYYKKINNYEEYSEVKSRWDNILDMNKEDFENNFMVITAIENTSMVGLTLDKIDTDDKGLYISLIHYEDGVEYDENETCISIKISRDLEKENIYVTRNLRDIEKDMSEEMQLAEKNTAIENLPSFQYKDENYRKAENSSNSTLRLIPPDWKDMISKNFTITKNMPEIDFSNWNDLGNDFYSIAITDYSEYLKLMNNYNAPKLTWFDFKYIYAIIVVRVNADNTIDIKDIESENGKSYLNVSIGGWLDVSEEFKYPAVCVAVPNYKSLESNFLNVRVK